MEGGRKGKDEKREGGEKEGGRAGQVEGRVGKGEKRETEEGGRGERRGRGGGGDGGRGGEARPGKENGKEGMERNRSTGRTEQEEPQVNVKSPKARPGISSCRKQASTPQGYRCPGRGDRGGNTYQ